jgi:hypothetical protein
MNLVLVSAEYGGAPSLCSGVSLRGKASNILEFLYRNRKHFYQGLLNLMNNIFKD